MVAPLSDRYLKAFQYAFKLHKHQRRKGSNTPYITHLMTVSSLVLENGGTEDQAIAALLHDSVEDQGGRKTLKKIRSKFGDGVAEIVDGCTDSYQTPKPPWKPRKEAYLEKLRHADQSVLLVALADKVHNARCLLADLQIGKDNIWDLFKGGKEGTLWYYQTLAEIFKGSPFNNLQMELRILVERIRNLSG
jgi:(p)ppGpp synthase/HD superfamily hydrolase